MLQEQTPGSMLTSMASTLTVVAGEVRKKMKSCQCTGGASGIGCRAGCPCASFKTTGKYAGLPKEGCGPAGVCNCKNCTNPHGRGGLNPNQKVTMVGAERKENGINFTKLDNSYRFIYTVLTFEGYMKRIEILYCSTMKKDDVNEAVAVAPQGARALYSFIQEDLILSQMPFRSMNDGNVLQVYEVLPLIACRLEYCGHPKLANWVLYHLDDMLYWSQKHETTRDYLSDVLSLSEEAKLLHRGDILATHGGNCKDTNDVLQEFDNGQYSEDFKSGAEYSQTTWEMKANSNPGRKAFMRDAKVECGLDRKKGQSEIRRLYHRFEKDSFKEDREIVGNWLIELACSALRGDMDDWVREESFVDGLDELLKTGIKRAAAWETTESKVRR